MQPVAPQHYTQDNRGIALATEPSYLRVARGSSRRLRRKARPPRRIEFDESHIFDTGHPCFGHKTTDRSFSERVLGLLRYTWEHRHLRYRNLHNWYGIDHRTENQFETTERVPSYLGTPSRILSRKK